MPRAKTNKLYRTFVKGLITEAGLLTYPEDASTDELNTVIKSKGTRSRRLGIDYEPDSTASTIDGITDADVVNEFVWSSVDNDADEDFLCIQIGSTVYFYDLNSEPVSAGKKDFSIDLLTYKVSSVDDSVVAAGDCSFASGKGFLFIAHENIEPLVVEYDAATDTISVVKVIIQIRDFDGVDDGLANEEQPSTMSKEHLYNLRNQGWVGGRFGAIEGPGSTDPYTSPGLPSTSPNIGTYDPYTGAERTHIGFDTP